MRIEDCFEICVKKTKNNIHKMKWGLCEYPSAQSGNYFDVDKSATKDFMHIMNWTASFFTGMSILAYRKTNDTELLDWLNAQYSLYYDKVFKNPEENMHDLGFLYSLYSVGMSEITHDKKYRTVTVKAADELAKRFVFNGGYIRAWGRVDGKVSDYVSEQDAQDHFFTKSNGLAIIDSMMNIPLLFRTAKMTSNPFYDSIAQFHANTVKKYFIRDDGSVYHAYRFDKDGVPVGGCNFCGYGDESFWARGATWAIYGFALAYGYTEKDEYLQTAIQLANKFIDELSEELIPEWDFRLPGTEKQYEDSSAAAIAVCAFDEILRYKKSERIKEYADLLINKLATEEYTDINCDCPGILKHQNGKETYTPYGDYFYMEALSKRLGYKNLCW